MNKTYTVPPKEIYDVLHEAEAKGIDLPESIEKWWEIETALNEHPKCKTCLDRGTCDGNVRCYVFAEIIRDLDLA